jgi:pimeloyl-ACP methyl ester carboxylesterase
LLPRLLASRRVHLVTLPGHRGGVPLSYPESLRSMDYVDAVEAELDGLGIDQADLVGNSLGGWIALQLAGRGRAASVVCLAPAGGWASGGSMDRFLAAQFSIAFRACRRLLKPRGQRMLHHPRMRRALLSSMVVHPERVDDSAYLTTVKDIAGCEALERSLHRLEARDLSWVPKIDCPVLIAWSARDRVLISKAGRRRLEQQVGRPRVVVVPDVGHVPMSDAPERIGSLILEFSASSQPTGESAGGTP